MVSIKGITNQVRQIAVRNVGRDEPTLMLTNALTAPAQDLFTRYAERMIIENEPTPTSAASTSTRSPPACRSTLISTPR
jgi:hypothetical protein